MSEVENPYQTPVADLHTDSSAPPLAARGSRLGAVLIDSLLMSVLTVPVLYLIGFYEGLDEGKQPSLGLQLAGALFGMVVFLLLNGHLLRRYGQTIGKRLLKIAIVDLNGDTPAWLPMYLKRYLVWGLLVYIPYIGGLLVLVDCLFIFRGDRRCLHDLLAGTRVVAVP
ncbi:RDD family protein [Pseudomonas sp. UL073]|uniref:RDD family protein n=1 Tax=Zestomonas insulae TaxID=2809017 RepID=A0ABS2I7W3_9GAMM|nr:RDD family protein [Pseudomonas insulae]MBM7059241.1 RDD family protein [Pseudomonas insulae]